MPQPRGPRDAEDAERRAELLLKLRQRGMRDLTLLRVIESVPREAFVTPELRDDAYGDHALPIDCGQTISQPSLVALMTEQLRLSDRDKVLEIGTGSGYQTAILARLARRVYSIDRYRTLVAAAEKRLAELGITNVTCLAGDGSKGWPAQAPFDRIIVTAAAPEVPTALVEQLRDDGGIMVVPVGADGGNQRLLRLEKKGGAVATTDLGPVRFVPLVAGKAESL
ncbi:MAG TPA: protein-L-isoaspartate(D-aspartate) O-methyltransferase [Hyphomicrobiales bacterium]|nr:protein-L-isoaspartate(D-aspartate) O-methyltransferase [Hyphomicrobiales bacterium]